MRALLIFAVALFAMSGSVSVRAEDAAPAPAAEPAKEAAPPAGVDMSNPHIEKIKQQALALADTLNEQQARDLGMIRENFGVIRSIGVAKKSVGDAVNLCAEKNPGLKAGIKAKFKSWDDEIGGALKKQEKTLKASVNKDRFSDPKQINTYLDTIDDAAKYADGQIEKQIVTTEAACTNLMNSMDETKEVILKLVTNLEWPGDAAKEAAPATQTP